MNISLDPKQQKKALETSCLQNKQQGLLPASLYAWKVRRNDDLLRCVKPSHDFSFLKGLSYSTFLCKGHCKVVFVLGFPSLCLSLALPRFSLRGGVKTKSSRGPNARQLPKNLSLMLTNIGQEITVEYQSTYKNEVHPK